MQKVEFEFSHRPVLLQETIELIDLAKCKVVVDATFGLGGHSEAILEASPEVIVLGIDQDENAIAMSTERLSRFSDRLNIVHGNFADIKTLIEKKGYLKADAIIADLGVSSLQLDDAGRGFSFRFDAPLDMRMDRSSDNQTVSELLATIGEVELANTIFEYGEERFSRRIARRIIERRSAGEPVTTTKELAQLVERSVRRNPKDKIHPATRTFQALRIAVNRELEMLEKFVYDAVECLRDRGVLALITFHSLEDRIVKRAFLKMSGKCSCPPRIPQCVCGARKRVEILTRKPILPGDAELNENPRSRSAKLRACRSLGIE